MFVDHIVDQKFRGVGQNETGEFIDYHQHEAEGKQSATRTHQHPDFGQNGLQPLDLWGLRRFFCWGTQSPV